VPLRTFEGPNVGSLLAQIRGELGPDAVILDVAQRGQGVALTAADPETAQTLVRPRAKIERPSTAHRASLPTAPPRPAGPAERTPTDANRPEKISVPRPDRTAAIRSDAAPLVLAFVGPTGAGKTTTIAKLAAHQQLFGRAQIGILNLDTYRVGATEQISQYAALSGVPVASAHSIADLRAARQTLRSCGVVLVDCPGRGPQFHRDLAAVGEMLDALRTAERHLVMPVGTQPALVRRTVEHFTALHITHLLATKVDEMPDDWILFDVAADLGLPMRWLADGQAIPQDLRSATARLDAAATNRRLRMRTVVAGVA
jgi:flagellar biosynthesis GTPase FlhF